MAGEVALYLMLLFAFIALTVLSMNKYVVPTQVVFDTVAAVELDTFDIYMMHDAGCEVLDRAIDNFFEKYFFQFSFFTSLFIKNDNSSLIVIIAVTASCIGVFRI